MKRKKISDEEFPLSFSNFNIQTDFTNTPILINKNPSTCNFPKPTIIYCLQ